MPFWWRRRRKPWWGRWRRRWTTKKYKTRRRRRRLPRRRGRGTTRRRRRRRYKVRRKRQTIAVRQWQPDSITRCKIKGFGTFIMGSEGKQYQCYTNVKEDYIPPKSPSGGGFAAELFSLSYLYEEYKFHRNIWTKSNILKDLVRYLRCTFYFFRHPDQDLIFAYERQPPFNIDKWTYTATHPTQLLLQKHKVILLSTSTNPRGRPFKKKTIKPPKQMLTKWFFTEHFCSYPLLFLKGSVASFKYPTLGCCNQSTQVNIAYLNQTFYVYTDWGNEVATTNPYIPHDNVKQQLKYKGPKSTTYDKTFTKPNTYAASVQYSTGWFNPDLLQAVAIEGQDSLPISYGRYLPASDDGHGNAIFFCSVTKKKPIAPTDLTLIYKNLPLWLMLWGFTNYILLVKKDKTFLNTHFLVIQSPAIYIYKTSQTVPLFIPVDDSFIKGRAPYEEYLTDTMKVNWYPTFKHQMETLNAIVTTGPYVPKLGSDKKSTWEFTYRYVFHFKWGGPQTTDQEVTDPSKLPEYDVPDHLQGTVQITNPAKQIASSFLHDWDIRRGFVTQRALKRISEHIETDTDFLPDTEVPQKKRQRVTAQLRAQTQEEEEMQTCLRSLFEENTSQEKTEDLQQLIQQQREQQDQLKYNLLKLLSNLKKKQTMLQLQTGLLN
nr:MAG: ORF1 [Torque teno midi virus]